MQWMFQNNHFCLLQLIRRMFQQFRGQRNLLKK